MEKKFEFSALVVPLSVYKRPVCNNELQSIVRYHYLLYTCAPEYLLNGCVSAGWSDFFLMQFLDSGSLILVKGLKLY